MKYQPLLFTLCFLGGVFGGTTSTLMPSYLPVLINEFGQHDADHIGALINAVFIVGMLLGGLSIGFLSDQRGRKTGFLVAIGCLGFFTLATAFLSSWELVLVCRFFTGVGVGGVLLIGNILVSEAYFENKRSIALGILSIAFPVGIFSAGLITYNVSSWHNAFLFGVFPLLLTGLAYFFIKESDDWQQKQVEKAYNNTNTSIFKQPILKDLIQGSLIYGTMLIGLWAVLGWLPTWVQTLVLDSDGQKERGLCMMLFAVGGLVGGIGSGWLSNRVGMKSVMLCCFGGAFLLSILLFKCTTTLTIVSYLEMAAISLFFGMSQGTLSVYIPALFPTEVRSSATGFCFNISRIFTASIVFFVGALVTTLGGYGNALFTFSFIFLLGFLLLLLQKTQI